MELKCRYCGLTPPRGKHNAERWMAIHEANCPRNPGHNKTNGPIGTE